MIEIKNVHRTSDSECVTRCRSCKYREQAGCMFGKYRCIVFDKYLPLDFYCAFGVKDKKYYDEDDWVFINNNSGDALFK